MNIRIREVGDAGIRAFMGRIIDQADLHDALAEIARQHHIHTATFELLGGLHQVTFTAYDFERQERLPPLTFRRPMEILSGHGTISQLDEQPHIHTHLTVSFRDENAPHGIAVVGGHAAKATVFAIEFTLTSYDGTPMRRALEESIGLALWNPEMID